MHFSRKGQTEKGRAAEQYQGRVGHVIRSVETTLALNSVDNKTMIIRQPEVQFCIIQYIMDYRVGVYMAVCVCVCENNQGGVCYNNAYQIVLDKARCVSLIFLYIFGIYLHVSHLKT